MRPVAVDRGFAEFASSVNHAQSPQWSLPALARCAGRGEPGVRMPVMLTREEEFDTWLRGSADEAFALAREYPSEKMRIVQEGSYKEDRVAA